MECKRLILALSFCATLGLVHAQDKAIMQQHQQRLVALLETVQSAPTDNQRYLASEDAIKELSMALEEERSERWQWQLPQMASVLTSDDGHLRLFTWAVVNDEGEYECFGAVQFYNSRDEEYQYRLLNDKSDEIMNREESMLPPERWLGAVYQRLIQTSHGGQTYYTLLGWNGVDNLTDRQVIEPVTFRGGEPQFGGPLFRRERNLRRVVLEYKEHATVNLSYEDQYVEVITRERVKVKGTNRHRTVEKSKVHKEKMIMFDEIEPQVPGMEGLFQYYVPSGVELAYAFVDGKWELRNGAQGRLDDKKLNKPFEPMSKSQPAYNYK